MTTRAPTTSLYPWHAISWRMTLNTFFSVHTLTKTKAKLDAP
jgi:hypothetical protein